MNLTANNVNSPTHFLLCLVFSDELPHNDIALFDHKQHLTG